MKIKKFRKILFFFFLKDTMYLQTKRSQGALTFPIPFLTKLTELRWLARYLIEQGSWGLEPSKDCGRAEASPKHWEKQGDLGTHLRLLFHFPPEVLRMCLRWQFRFPYRKLGPEFVASSSFAPEFE